MHPRTIATLEKLENVDWFQCVGVQDTERAIVVASWQEAIVHCSSVEWENLCLEAANQLRERILEQSKVEFEKWNDIAAEVKQAVEPLVRRKVGEVVRQNDLPQVVEDTVQWDILHVCMEAEYAEVFPPAFYASQAYWYVKGHFPCGWQGDFPEGTLIVY